VEAAYRLYISWVKGTPEAGEVSGGSRVVTGNQQCLLVSADEPPSASRAPLIVRDPWAVPGPGLRPSMFRSVVFPAPEGPMIAIMRPICTSPVTPLSMVLLSNFVPKVAPKPQRHLSTSSYTLRRMVSGAAVGMAALSMVGMSIESYCYDPYVGPVTAARPSEVTGMS
jgi:hypothetical protein